MESLSRFLTYAETQNLIHGIKLSTDAPAINHLLCADDCMVFCKANLEECNNLIKFFQEFSQSSGKMINFAKSGIFFSKNAGPYIADRISTTMKIQKFDIKDNYLGYPLFTSKSKVQAFKPFIDKLKYRIAGWKATLSTAGKGTMIQFVTSTSSIYQINCFKFPKATCKEINAIQRDFFWNKGQDKLKEPHSLWRCLMKALHFPNEEVIRMDTKPKLSDSWIWKGILEGIINIQKYYIWKIGKDDKIHNWEDRLFEGQPEIIPKPPNFPTNMLYVSNLFNSTGDWDTDILALWENFSVKSIYDKQTTDKYANDVLTSPCAKIWDLDTSPAIHLFIWKCSHGILPTNVKNASILTYIDPICNVGKSAKEDITHVLLTCPAASDVWERLFGNSHQLFSNVCSFHDWFNGWFIDHNENASENATYATTCWFIWKARCDLVLRNIFPAADGQCVGARNYIHTTIGFSRATRIARGPHLAIEWGMEMQKSNIDFAAEDDAILQSIQEAYQVEVQERFKTVLLILKKDILKLLILC
ncbi:uncharacterized protein LOC113350742 [Papaver somniferum]|uniref:uncharacterized protein LOC113350742 n=1 Tax=Papaver somniferum TaxID=3469 RepID=UPI000E700D04|nr:uncharacterized protein LOC113350742 [Papaver somniferum]